MYVDVGGDLRHERGGMMGDQGAMGAGGAIAGAGGLRRARTQSGVWRPCSLSWMRSPFWTALAFATFVFPVGRHLPSAALLPLPPESPVLLPPWHPYPMAPPSEHFHRMGV